MITHMFMPARMPPAPSPLSALPIIKAVDVGAVAESTEPIQKMMRDISYKVFME